jgi:hypothetical protein
MELPPNAHLHSRHAPDPLVMYNATQRKAYGLTAKDAVTAVTTRKVSLLIRLVNTNVLMST